MLRKSRSTSAERESHSAWKATWMVQLVFLNPKGYPKPQLKMMQRHEPKQSSYSL